MKFNKIKDEIFINGNAARRDSWEENIILKLHINEEEEEKESFLYLEDVDKNNKIVKLFNPSLEDLHANDWIVIF